MALIIITYSVGALELVLGVYLFLTTNKGNEVRRTLSVTVLFVSLWVFTSALLSQSASVEVNKSLYLLGVIFLTLLLHFCLVYPIRLRSVNTLLLFAIYVPTIMLILVTLFTDTVLKGAYITSGGFGWPIGGSLFVFYNGFLFFLWLLMLTVLYVKSKQYDGRQKNDIRLFGASIFISGLPPLYTDLIVPSFGGAPLNPLYGNIATIIWVLVITYLLKRSYKPAEVD